MLSLFVANNAQAGIIVKSPAYLGLQRGLVGCWSFDGAYTKVPDCSGNNNTSTLINGPTKVAGKVGQAFKFNGVDDVIQTDTATGMGTLETAKTISLWFYSNGFNDANNEFLFALKTAGLDTTDIGFWGGNIQAGKFGSGSGLVTGCDYFPSEREWHLFTYTFNGVDSNKIYIDGVDRCGNTSTPDTGTITYVMFGHEGFSSFFFNGKIDETRIYNRALSANEVARLYKIGLGSTVNRPTSALDKGLVGHWTFDGPDISGTRAKDRSGNNNHGTLNGGASLKPAIGKVGQALDFDGSNDSINVAETTGLPIYPNNTAYSVSAWVKGSGTQTDKVVWAECNATCGIGNGSFSVGTDTGGTGKVSIWLHNNAGTIILNNVNSTGVGFDNTWHHIVWALKFEQLYQIFFRV